MLAGLYTALITPFLSDGSIDEQNLYRLIDHQIENGVDGIVLLGTTGESPTISSQEHDELIAKATQYINKRCKVIAGTGSNCTREAIHHSQQAQLSGVDALLVVNPYYNKPTQKGLYQHFTAVADAVEIPIILYNIEGRTGVNLNTSTLLELAKHPRIVGVKEASGDLIQIEEVINSVPENFVVLSGDDGITAQVMQMGGHGVVSVASNILPQEMTNMVQAGLRGDWITVQAINQLLHTLFDTLFIETNPQPIKTLLSHEGWCEEVFRLPLTTMEDNNKSIVLQTWQQLQVLN